MRFGPTHRFQLRQVGGVPRTGDFVKYGIGLGPGGWCEPAQTSPTAAPGRAIDAQPHTATRDFWHFYRVTSNALSR